MVCIMGKNLYLIEYIKRSCPVKWAALVIYGCSASFSESQHFGVFFSIGTRLPRKGLNDYTYYALIILLNNILWPGSSQ